MTGDLDERRFEHRLDWRVLLAVWVGVAAFFAARTLLGADHVVLLADTDDAMRLVVVRDLLAGQGWYDHLQHRLNTPFGAELHWSRLADLPIAGLILLLRPLLGGFAETATAWLWPLVLLLPLLWLSGRVALRLVGRDGLLPGLALPAFSPAIAAEFSPGRLDHHSLQILLVLGLLWCSIEALRRPRFAIGAGLVAATALAIGLEAAPLVAAAILVFGLMWVFRPERCDALLYFGLSFGVGTLAHLAVALPPGRWLEPACDGLSIVYATAAFGIGLAFAILSFLPVAEREAWFRLLLAAAAGAAVAGGLAWLFPACLDGPFAALDPWLIDNWLAGIVEAKPLWESLPARPGLTIAIGLPPILGLLVVGFRLGWGERAGRGGWWVLAAYLGVAVLVMLVQVRGARLAAPLAVPAGAWLIAAARARYLAMRTPVAAAGLVGSWLAFAGVVMHLFVNVGVQALERAPAAPPGNPAAAAGKPASGTTGADETACLRPETLSALARLPPARVMTPIDLGAHVLLHTPHSVVAAPYHRNQAGVRDGLEFFNGRIDAARAILQRRGVTLVVVCPGMSELRGRRPVADSFVRLYAQNALPGWLEDVSVAGGLLRIFKVRATPGG